MGWSMADHMRTELVAGTIWMAHAGGHAAGKAVFRSDRGSRCTSHPFRDLLGESDIRQRAGRAGSRFGGAAAENSLDLRKRAGSRRFGSFFTDRSPGSRAAGHGRFWIWTSLTGPMPRHAVAVRASGQLLRRPACGLALVTYGPAGRRRGCRRETSE
ncbi:hypothetical protein [Streptomyces sp. NBC_01207]|uniref:hypothetical protein n=1 Tax=Streptomyces sp. NBC_01207 TaxID=2903772 RepID=UPI003FA37104